ncbi:MAG TPA: hypothetical protein VL443_06965 [Cyclobacteriaceae bacterium]|nr:hypothetical protein [Cyclobacteriaceae bacterium]
MKSIVVSIFILALACLTGFAQDKNSFFISFGTPLYVNLDGPTLNTPTLGVDFGVVKQITSHYFVGVGLDYTKESGLKAIDIPNNGIDDETIRSTLKVTSLRVINRLNLLSSSHATQLFINTKLGFRTAKFKNSHVGYENGIKKVLETIYKNDNIGLSGEITLGVYFPFIKSDPSYLGLQINSGITTGTKVNYIDKTSVHYTNSTFVHGPIRKSNGTFLINTISLAWRIGKMKK